MSTDLDNFLHNALDGVENITSINAFYHQFQTIKSMIASCQSEIPEPYFASRFVYGLSEEFQSFIFKFQPTTVTAAYKLACIYEESICLHYFPKLACQRVDLSVENNDIENHLVVPDVDKDSEMIIGEDLSSVCNFVVDSTGSNQGKEDIIDILVDGSVVLRPNQDTPDSLKVTPDLHLDNVAFKMAYQQSMSPGESDTRGSSGTVVQLPVVGRVSVEEESVEQYQGLENTCQNKLELLVIKEAKVHPTDVTIIFVDSNGYSGVYDLRKNNGGNDIVAVIFIRVFAWLRVGVMSDCQSIRLIETIVANFTRVIHFRFNWESGPFASQCQVDSIWRSNSREQGFFFLVCFIPDIVIFLSKAGLVHYSSELRYPETAQGNECS